MKYVVKTLDEAFDEKESEIKKAVGDTVTFTPDEAKQVLTIMIEDSARWKLYDYFPSVGNFIVENSMVGGETYAPPPVPELNQKAIDGVVDRVYRNLVKDWRYDTVLLQICRKSKFDITMVRTIVDDVIKKMKSEAKSNGTSNVSKSLLRSIERVRTVLNIPDSQTLMKSDIDIDTLRKAGISYPERLYAFLKY